MRGVEIILLTGRESDDFNSIRNLLRCGHHRHLHECSRNDKSLEMIARCDLPVDAAYRPHTPTSLNLPHVDVGWTQSAWLSCRENASQRR